VSADPTRSPLDEQVAEECLYVYGIVDGGRQVPANDVAALSSGEGLEPAPLCLATVDRVAAVYSPLDPRSLTATAEDLAVEQLAGLAHRHDAVLRSLAAAGPVLPMRLGTLCADESRLTALLRRSTTQILAALDDVRGSSEWSVRVSAQPSASSSPADESTGTQYLLGRRQQRRRAVEQAESVARTAAVMDDELAALARRTRDRLRRADTVLARSYLVADAERDDLMGVLAATTEWLRAAGCTVEVEGPLPPYSFTDVELEVAP
jgi:hypothetical protein